MALETAGMQQGDPKIPMSWVPARPEYRRVVGPCDTDGTTDRNRLQQWRYQIALFQFAVVGNDGTLAGGGPATLTLWREGVGDIGAQAGWGAASPVLTNMETNLFSNGSFNNAIEGAFVGRALGFAFQRAFTYTVATGARVYSDATDRYAARASRMIAESMSMAVRDRDEGTILEVASPPFWGSHAQIGDETFPTIGSCVTPTSLVPMREDYVFLNDTTGSKTQLILTIPRPLTLLGDPAEPVPAGFSVPLVSIVYGFPIAKAGVCEPDPGASGAGAKAAALRDLIASGLTPAQAYDLLKGR